MKCQDYFLISLFLVKICLLFSSIFLTKLYTIVYLNLKNFFL